MENITQNGSQLTIHAGYYNNASSSYIIMFVLGGVVLIASIIYYALQKKIQNFITGAIFSIAILTFGFYYFLMQQSGTIVLNKSTNTLSVSESSNLNKSSQEYDLSTVKAIDVRPGFYFKHSGPIYPAIYADFTNGQSIFLTDVLNVNQFNSEGEEIASFLDIPYSSSYTIGQLAP